MASVKTNGDCTVMNLPDRIFRMTPEEIERQILGSCFDDPGILNHVRHECNEKQFSDPFRKKLFIALKKYPGNKIDLPILAGMIDDPDVAFKLAELSECVSAAETIRDLYLPALREAAALYEIETACNNAISQVSGGEIVSSVIGEQLRNQIEKIDNATDRNFEKFVFVPTPENKPEEKPALVELCNVKILSRGNISMVNAGAGVGKTSTLDAGCSSVITPMIDSLGIVFKAASVLYIDTERSIFDHHTSWQRYLRRAGLAASCTPPAAVRWENIRGIDSLADRKKYLGSRIDVDNVPDLVIADGIGDFVGDPNDSPECTALVSWLCSVAHRRNIGILVTLHNNPAMNSTKARGVLGSELWRKCESVLIIEKLPDGIRRITTDYALGKNRSASDTVSSYFRWDDGLKMHVSCNAPAETSGKKAVGRDTILNHLGDTKWSYSDLSREIMTVCSKSEATAKRWIKELCEIGSVVKNTDNTYQHRSTGDSGMGWIHD